VQPPSVLIIGGGIAGLAAAIAIRRIGASVRVYEQSNEVREIGAGLSVWRNGLDALERLGALGPVLGAASPIRTLENTDWRGRVLQRCPVGWLGRHAAIQRPQLLNALLRLVPPDSIFTGRRLAAVDQDSSGVTAHFADGSEARADAIIGADGLWSVVRPALNARAEPTYAGHVAWRGIAEFPHERWPVGVATSAMGCGKHFAVEPLLNGRIFWYSTHNMPEHTDAPPTEGIVRELLQHFSDCYEPVPALIAATPTENIVRNRVYDLPAPGRWAHGRIAIVGDAAHAMRPNLGQGACQALEDAVVLGACLRDASDIPGALRRYERRRLRRARWIVYWSRQISLLEQIDRPRRCAARDFCLGWLNPGVMNLPWFWTIVHFFGAPN
jgi:2-polyprenyl-6-methoxyphenol hydroxylase-like FAD-dependent oxidoreductase